MGETESVNASSTAFSAKSGTIQRVQSSGGSEQASDQARLEIIVELDRRRRRLAMLPPQGRLLALFTKPLL